LQSTTEEYDCPSLFPPGIMSNSPSLYTDYDATYYSCSIINPNNVDEIIYLDGMFPDGRLMFYNIATKEKRVLFDDDVTGGLSWSKKDWILFQDTQNFSIYKIKSNGDSLTRLTFDGNIFFPRWNHNGTKFIVSNKNIVMHSFIMNEDGQVIDSITDWNHTNGNWSHPLYYAGGSSFEIKLIDLENHLIFDKLHFDKEVDFLGWASNSEIFYRIGPKLILYNIYTRVKTIIKEQCDIAAIWSSSSTDFSRILFQIIENSWQPNNRLLVDSKLVVMKKDGTDEIEILP
jgi:hypothetical protein